MLQTNRKTVIVSDNVGYDQCCYDAVVKEMLRSPSHFYIGPRPFQNLFPVSDIIVDSCDWSHRPSFVNVRSRVRKITIFVS